MRMSLRLVFWGVHTWLAQELVPCYLVTLHTSMDERSYSWLLLEFMRCPCYLSSSVKVFNFYISLASSQA